MRVFARCCARDGRGPKREVPALCANSTLGSASLHYPRARISQRYACFQASNAVASAMLLCSQNHDL